MNGDELLNIYKPITNDKTTEKDQTTQMKPVCILRVHRRTLDHPESRQEEEEEEEEEEILILQIGDIVEEKVTLMANHLMILHQMTLTEMMILRLRR